MKHSLETPAPSLPTVAGVCAVPRRSLTTGARVIPALMSHCGKYLYRQRSFTWQPASTRLRRADLFLRGGAIHVFKYSFVAAVMLCALSAMAQPADCTRVAAAGDNITHDLAVLFSTNALKNTIAGRGLIGKGPLKPSCESGSAMIQCHSSQMACKGGTPATCSGPWLCF